MLRFLKKRFGYYHKRAVAINIIENDSLYIHADTLLEQVHRRPVFQGLLRGKKILKETSEENLFPLEQAIGRIELLKRPLWKRSKFCRRKE